MNIDRDKPLQFAISILTDGIALKDVPEHLSAARLLYKWIVDNAEWPAPVGDLKAAQTPITYIRALVPENSNVPTTRPPHWPPRCRVLRTPILTLFHAMIAACAAAYLRKPCTDKETDSVKDCPAVRLHAGWAPGFTDTFGRIAGRGPEVALAMLPLLPARLPPPFDQRVNPFKYVKAARLMGCKAAGTSPSNELIVSELMNAVPYWRHAAAFARDIRQDEGGNLLAKTLLEPFSALVTAPGLSGLCNILVSPHGRHDGALSNAPNHTIYSTPAAAAPSVAGGDEFTAKRRIFTEILLIASELLRRPVGALAPAPALPPVDTLVAITDLASRHLRTPECAPALQLFAVVVARYTGPTTVLHPPLRWSALAAHVAALHPADAPAATAATLAASSLACQWVVDVAGDDSLTANDVYSTLTTVSDLVAGDSIGALAATLVANVANPDTPESQASWLALDFLTSAASAAAALHRPAPLALSLGLAALVSGTPPAGPAAPAPFAGARGLQSTLTPQWISTLLAGREARISAGRGDVRGWGTRPVPRALARLATALVNWVQVVEPQLPVQEVGIVLGLVAEKFGHVLCVDTQFNSTSYAAFASNDCVTAELGAGAVDAANFVLALNHALNNTVVPTYTPTVDAAAAALATSLAGPLTRGLALALAAAATPATDAGAIMDLNGDYTTAYDYGTFIHRLGARAGPTDDDTALITKVLASALLHAAPCQCQLAHKGVAPLNSALCPPAAAARIAVVAVRSAVILATAPAPAPAAAAHTALAAAYLALAASGGDVARALAPALDASILTNLVSVRLISQAIAGQHPVPVLTLLRARDLAARVLDVPADVAITNFGQENVPAYVTAALVSNTDHVDTVTAAAEVVAAVIPPPASPSQALYKGLLESNSVAVALQRYLNEANNDLVLISTASLADDPSGIPTPTHAVNSAHRTLCPLLRAATSTLLAVAAWPAPAALAHATGATGAVVRELTSSATGHSFISALAAAARAHPAVAPRAVDIYVHTVAAAYALLIEGPVAAGKPIAQLAEITDTLAGLLQAANGWPEAVAAAVPSISSMLATIVRAMNHVGGKGSDRAAAAAAAAATPEGVNQLQLQSMLAPGTLPASVVTAPLSLVSSCLSLVSNGLVPNASDRQHSLAAAALAALAALADTLANAGATEAAEAVNVAVVHAVTPQRIREVINAATAAPTAAATAAATLLAAAARAAPAAAADAVRLALPLVAGAISQTENAGADYVEALSVALTYFAGEHDIALALLVSDALAPAAAAAAAVATKLDAAVFYTRRQSDEVLNHLRSLKSLLMLITTAVHAVLASQLRAEQLAAHRIAVRLVHTVWNAIDFIMSLPPLDPSNPTCELVETTQSVSIALVRLSLAPAPPRWTAAPYVARAPGFVDVAVIDMDVAEQFGAAEAVPVSLTRLTQLLQGLTERPRGVGESARELLDLLSRI